MRKARVCMKSAVTNGSWGEDGKLLRSALSCSIFQLFHIFPYVVYCCGKSSYVLPNFTSGRGTFPAESADTLLRFAPAWDGESQ